jgi:hypothetical protein
VYWLEIQGLICPRCSFAALQGFKAVECRRGNRVRGGIDLWVFVPLSIVCSSGFLGEFLLRTFKIVFYRDMLLIYLKTYRNIVCLKYYFVPTKKGQILVSY